MQLHPCLTQNSKLKIENCPELSALELRFPGKVDVRSRFDYRGRMLTMPIPVRLSGDLADLLKEGVRRTHHKQAALVRLTLSRHLRAVIEEEAAASPERPLTSIKPWPKGALARAYRKAGNEDDATELAIARGMAAPSFED